MADCLFCAIVAGTVPAFTVVDDPAGIGFLDTRPVFKGHVIVVPRTRCDGLRGFFWPRTKYASDSEALEYAERIRAKLG